jgi:Na+-transporting methylmalonyl-CoA/oxaloacetate decarboxylase gamma subunit
MTVPESILVTLFVMAVVFLVLILLSLILKVFSKVLSPIANKSDQKAVLDANSAIQNSLQNREEVFSSGLLKLKNVDEPTAAILMAIVSDESEIPLSELCFKSISFVREYKNE